MVPFSKHLKSPTKAQYLFNFLWGAETEDELGLDDNCQLLYRGLRLELSWAGED